MAPVVRLLHGVSALLVAIGLAAWLAVWLAPRAGSGAAVPATGAGSPDDAVATDRRAAPSARSAESLAIIVESNVFAPDRRPPRVKFTLAPRAEAPPPLRRIASGPRVYGITMRSDDPTALIDGDPTVPGAEIYRVGDSVGGALIVDINDSTVVLEGPSGRRVLRLERRPRP